MKKVSAFAAAVSMASTCRRNDGMAISSADFDDRTRMSSIHFTSWYPATPVPANLPNNYDNLRLVRCMLRHANVVFCVERNMLRLMTVDISDFFRQMTLHICGSLDIDLALGQTFAYASQHLPVDAMGLGYFDLATAQIRTVARASKAGARTFWDEEIELSATSRQFVETSHERPPILIVNSPDDQPAGLIEAFPELCTSSAIFVRLMASGEEVGALLVTADGANRYTPVHAHLLESVREPFAIAMVNARRHRELAHARDRLAEDHRALAAGHQASIRCRCGGG